MLWEWENGAARVYILDLDGTLMPTAAIDNECYWQAVFGVFDKHGQLPDLHDFKNVSDGGILHEWCMRELGRPASAQETTQIKRLFGEFLQSAFALQPGHFSPLPGVDEWLAAIRCSRHVLAGIATGGWEHSARLKLKYSGLDRFDLPLASSDDAIERTAIMRIAAQRTLGQQAVEDTFFTYVGDGAWDVAASRALNWGFIGIATGQQALRLRQAGANLVQENFCRN
jgi:phosphoglycolate phosphatase-like HAD superfamily hydrolase